MKKQDSQTIANVLQELLQEDRFCQKLNETKLIESWGEIVGEVVKTRTDDIYIKNKILFVKIQSPALKSDLRMKTSDLIQSLNRSVGCNVIQDIRFL